MPSSLNPNESWKYTYPDYSQDIAEGWLFLITNSSTSFINYLEGLPHKVVGTVLVGFHVFVPEWIYRVVMVMRIRDLALYADIDPVKTNKFLHLLNDTEELRNAVMAMIRLDSGWTQIERAVESWR